MQSLVGIGDLDADGLRDLLHRAQVFEKAGRKRGARGLDKRLAGHLVCTAFFEPSTRTRLSFESAALRLGAQVLGFSDSGSTSSRKGETLEDTVRVLSGYADCIVLRHYEKGSARRAASAASVPVINAGDGAGEHPTQTLVDLYTISQNLGRLDGVKVAMVGDLRYGRTVHSLLPALRTMGGDAVAVPAPGLELPDDLGASVPTVSLDVAARTCDVLYVTRIQEERLPDTQSYAKLKGMLRVDAALLKKTKSKAIVLHPLPRVDEISRDVDALPSAKYFDQARNGVVVRMAILDSILGETA